MKIRRLAAISTIAAATALPFASGSAIGDPTPCPDGYELTPVIAIPPDQKVPDRNNNFLVCAKGPQGSNEHFNTKDDKPQFVDDII